jgi:hypothetical protein
MALKGMTAGKTSVELGARSAVPIGFLELMLYVIIKEMLKAIVLSEMIIF